VCFRPSPQALRNDRQEHGRARRAARVLKDVLTDSALISALLQIIIGKE
jgi:hypothetical protein